MSQRLAVEAKGLQRKYGATCAVDHVDIEIPAGERTCIIGPNGAGKTTLLLMLSGALVPDSGQIRSLGLDRWEMNFEIRQRSTYLATTPIYGASETPYVFLRYYAQIYGIARDRFMERLEQMSRQMNMIDHLAKRWSQLSTGMLKKVGLIAVFLPEAELRIMDEPFAHGIDPSAIETLYSWMDSCRNNGETLIFSTQVLEHGAAVADRMLLLDEGRIIARGNVEELIAASGVDPESSRALYKAYMALTGRGEDRGEDASA
jgi:ABC-2 type transport system ATP-binding protein